MRPVIEVMDNTVYVYFDTEQGLSSGLRLDAQGAIELGSIIRAAGEELLREQHAS